AQLAGRLARAAVLDVLVQLLGEGDALVLQPGSGWGLAGVVSAGHGRARRVQSDGQRSVHAAETFGLRSFECSVVVREIEAMFRCARERLPLRTRTAARRTPRLRRIERRGGTRAQ